MAGEPLTRPRVRGRPRRPLQEGLRPADPRPGRRADRDRSGRRLDRPRGPPGSAQGRARQRGRRSGAGLLRRGRARADRHRRGPAARLPRPEFFLGGRMRLDVDAARPAIESASPSRSAWPHRRRVGHPPRRQREHGQRGARARRRARQGPRDFRCSPSAARAPCTRGTSGAFSGAARPRAARGGRAVGLRPPRGAAGVRLRADRAPAIGHRGVDAINGLFEEMEAEGRGSCAAPAWRMGTSRSAAAPRCAPGPGARGGCLDPTGTLGDNSLAAITAAFEAAYRALYSRTPQGVPVEALNWRAVVSGPAPDRLGGSDGSVGCGRPRDGSLRRRRRRAAAGPTSRRRADTSRPRSTTATRSGRAPADRPRDHRGARVHHRHRAGRARHRRHVRTLIAARRPRRP